MQCAAPACCCRPALLNSSHGAILPQTAETHHPAPPLPQKVADTTIAALRWLGARDHTFIYWDDASRTYQPTPFGKAVLASGLPPEQCLVLKVWRGEMQGRWVDRGRWEMAGMGRGCDRRQPHVQAWWSQVHMLQAA